MEDKVFLMGYNIIIIKDDKEIKCEYKEVFKKKDLSHGHN